MKKRLLLLIAILFAIQGWSQNCPSPTNLVSTPSGNRAIISWMPGGTEAMWDIQYTFSSDSNWVNATSIYVTINSDTLTGLMPLTFYKVRVKAICSPEDESYWSNSLNFSTSSSPISTFPWIDGFENGLLAWNLSFSSISYPLQIVTSGVNPNCTPNGDSNMIFYGSYYAPSGSWARMISPEFNFSSNMEVSFFMYRDPGYPSNNDRVNVYVNSIASITGATLLGTTSRYRENAGWENISYIISQDLLEPKYLIFEAESFYGNNIYIDDIKVDLATSCPKPRNLLADTLTKTSARINWTAGGNETQWILQYKLSSDNSWVNANTINSISTNSFTLTGLTHSTSYDVRVKGICSQNNESLWSNVITFTTAYGIPFNESFSSSIFPPTNWTKLSGLASNAFAGILPTYTTSGWNRFTQGYGITGNHTRLNVYGINNKYWLVSPNIDLGSNPTMLSFDLALTAWNHEYQPYLNGIDDKFMVIISTDNGATWSQANATIWNNTGSPNVYNNISNTAQEINIDLSAYVNQSIKIAFYGESTINNADNDIHIDNINVDLIPTCPRPIVLLDSSSITTSSAIINWTAGGTETSWSLQYKPTSDTSWNNAIIINNITSNSYTLLSLQPSTSYDVRVRGICSLTDESNWTKISFNTSCGMVTSFPWSESFENGLNCWNLSSSGTVTNSFWQVKRIGELPNCIPHSGTFLAEYNSYSQPNTGWSTMASPALSFTRDMQVSFWMYRDNGYAISSYEGVSVFVNSTPDTIGATLLGHTPRYRANNGWDSITYQIPVASACTKYIILKAYSEYGNNIFVDDLSVSYIQSCDHPNEINVSNITQNEATINFTPSNIIDSEWEISYIAVGSQIWNNVNVNTVSYQLTGLIPNTSYEVYLRTLCSDSTYSGASQILNFHTACDNVITNINAEICEGYTYTENGFNVSTEGLHTLNLHRINGCDSTVNLTLTFKHNSTNQFTQSTCNSYTWNSSTYTTSGDYVQVFPNSVGCDSTVTLHLTIAELQTPKICMITVDSNNHNVVVWKRNEVVNYYNVYRQGTQSGQFNLMTTVPYSVPSWTDTSSNAAVMAYVYKISAIDTCSYESSLSLPHKTIHLTINQGVNNNWNLAWNPYEGITYTTYNIYRGVVNIPDSLELIATISGDNTSYTDINAPIGTIYYQIEILLNESCYPTKSYSSIRSNIVTNNSSSGLYNIENSNTNIQLYPNPTANKSTLEVQGLTKEADVIVYDIYGRKIKTYKFGLNQTKLEIDVNGFAPGVYNIKIVNTDCNITKKLIVK